MLHSKLAYLFVVLCIFGFQAYETINESQRNFYQTMGIRRYEVDQKLKTTFRQRVITLHPDKNSEADSGDFMKLKNIYEVLGSNASRAAYDCYGPENISQTHLSSAKSSARPTLKDYFTPAFYDWMIFYAGAVIVYFLQQLRGGRSGIYWKLLGLLSTMSIDLYILMHPEIFGVASKIPSSGLSAILGPLVNIYKGIPTFVKISLLRQVYMYFGIAVGHLSNMDNTMNPAKQKQGLIQRLALSASKCLVVEGRLLMSGQLAPFLENPEMQEALNQEISKRASPS